MTRKLKVGDKVKLVGEAWNHQLRDTIVSVDRISSGGVAYGLAAVGPLGPGNYEPYRGIYEVEWVEDEAKPGRRFKPGDRVHVEYDTVVHTKHTASTEGLGRVTIVHPALGGITTVPLDSVTKIAEPMPTGLGAVIRNKQTGDTYIRVGSDQWACGSSLVKEERFIWKHFHDSYEILSEGVQL